MFINDIGSVTIGQQLNIQTNGIKTLGRLRASLLRLGPIPLSNPSKIYVDVPTYVVCPSRLPKGFPEFNVT